LKAAREDGSSFRANLEQSTQKNRLMKFVALRTEQALDKRQDAFQGDKAKGVYASYQWELSGPNGGDWWLIVNDGTYKTGKGKIHNPNVTFVASDEDWVAMSNKTLNVSWAYLTGRLKIQGSHRLVKELDKIFP